MYSQRKALLIGLTLLVAVSVVLISFAPRTVTEPDIVVELGEENHGAESAVGPQNPIPTVLIGHNGQVKDPALAVEQGETHPEVYSIGRTAWLNSIRNKAPGRRVEPSGSKVVLLTATDGRGHNREIKDLFKQVTENREDYCAYHGYTYQFLNISKYHVPGRPAVWSKVNAIQDALNMHPEAEWMWWLDTDAIIMSPQVDLGSYLLSATALKTRLAYDQQIKLPNGKNSGLQVSRALDTNQIDIIISQDYHGLNAGSMFFRRTDFTMSLLDMWLDPIYVERKFERLEQDALNHLIVHHPSIREHVGIVNQRAINAYPGGDMAAGWHTGDLVIHFAGCWVHHQCEQQWTHYWNKRRKRVEVPAEVGA
ncbi:galactosyl transferase GMA12/MNN10 family-domain-containing protein [Lipomyces arxii]|uniref:galactosyl transferase GMA12/MNN10 family-domain-containing protein n=1 Tax=Lipomyces arxii TaxID=56418 RepID=UPI0034CD64A1